MPVAETKVGTGVGLTIPLALIGCQAGSEATRGRWVKRRGSLAQKVLEATDCGKGGVLAMGRKSKKKS